MATKTTELYDNTTELASKTTELAFKTRAGFQDHQADCQDYRASFQDHSTGCQEHQASCNCITGGITLASKGQVLSAWRNFFVGIFAMPKAGIGEPLSINLTN